MKAVVLLSGGMDSTTLLYDLVHEGHEVHALNIVYGSKHNHAERLAAQRIAERAEVVYTEADIDAIGQLFKSDLLLSGGDVPEGHYADESMKATVVPFRNGILLSLAAGFAESVEADIVAYAAHGGDHPIYPDCRPQFVFMMDRAIQEGTGGAVQLDAPYREMTKTDVCARGFGIGVPYELTWSCYQPVRSGDDFIHCGRCGTCTERKEAFRDSGNDDPTVYETK